MCLFATTRNKVRIAKKDIFVYKLVLQDINGEFISPYQCAVYRIGQIEEVPNFSAGSYSLEGNFKQKPFVTKVPKGTESIHEGLHAYTSVSKARLRSMEGILKGKFILKCIIPKGTRYIQSPKDKEIVALRLKPIGLISTS